METDNDSKAHQKIKYFCNAVINALARIAIISLRLRELVALLWLCFYCHVAVLSCKPRVTVTSCFVCNDK